MPSVTLKRQSGSLTTSVTEVGPWKLADDVYPTNNGAFGAISAKADLIQQSDAVTVFPADDAANGRYIRERPAGSSVGFCILIQGATGDTVDFRIWGWNQVHVVNANLANPQLQSFVQWTPRLLCMGTAIAAAKVGVANGLIDAGTHYMSDVSSFVDRTGTARIRAPGGIFGTPDTGAVEVLIDPLSSPLLEFEGRRNAGATAWNVLYAGLSGA